MITQYKHNRHSNTFFRKVERLCGAGLYTGSSNMYFNETAFSSAKRLFYTMAHEFNHVSQHALMAGTSYIKGLIELQEYHAYNYQHYLGGLEVNSGSLYNMPNLIRTFPDQFKSFHFTNFGWTKTVKFSPIKFN